MACWVSWWFVVIWLTLHGVLISGVCWVVASLGFLVVGGFVVVLRLRG